MKAADEGAGVRSRGAGVGRTVLRVLAAGGPLVAWWFLTEQSAERLMSASANVPIWALLLSALLSELGLAVYAARWRLLLRAFDSPAVPGVWSLYKRTLVGNFFGLFLPSSLGTDAIHGVLSRDLLPGRADPWVVVFVGRAFGLFALPVLCSAALLFVPTLQPLAEAAVFLAGLGSIVLFTLGTLSRNRLGQAMRGRLHKVAVVLPQVLRPHLLIRLVVLSLLSLSLGALAQLAILLPLVPEVSGSHVFVAILIAQLANNLPTVFGLGPGQLALVALLAPLGVPGPVAMGAALTRWVVGVSEALGGALLFVLGRTR